jgi:hypothetical protein
LAFVLYALTFLASAFHMQSVINVNETLPVKQRLLRFCVHVNIHDISDKDP